MSPTLLPSIFLPNVYTRSSASRWRLQPSLGHHDKSQLLSLEALPALRDELPTWSPFAIHTPARAAAILLYDSVLFLSPPGHHAPVLLDPVQGLSSLRETLVPFPNGGCFCWRIQLGDVEHSYDSLLCLWSPWCPKSKHWRKGSHC